MKRPVRLRYEAEARADLERIIDWGLAQGHPDPVGYTLALGERIAVLREHPQVGRGGRVKGTREMVIAGTDYIAVYRLDAAGVTVLRVLHAARQWPPAKQ